MKKLLLFLPFLFLLQACPIGLDYSMTEPGTEKINQNLIGTWKNDDADADVVKLVFSKDTKNSLKVEVLEKGEMYTLETDNLTAYQSVLNGKTFLILKPEGEDEYYHYCYELNGDRIDFFDVSLLDGGVDAVTSTETLRDQITRSMKMDQWGEEASVMRRVK